MKKPSALLAAGILLLSGAIVSHAVIIDIDLSPVGGTALNLGAPPTHYFGDHAVGIAQRNETAAPPSPATGNEIGAGIKFDSVTKMLSFDIGYGSAFGFTDLVGAFTDVHFHSPGAVNFPAPNTSAAVIHPLSAFHTAFGPMDGKITGAVMLSAGQEMALFDNLIYINIHSTHNGPGEIRGQLIPVPEPSAVALLLLGLASVAYWFRRR